MPRFVVLEHDHPNLHWDLMLEQADGLRTWRLAEFPTVGRTVGAELTFVHRSVYLEYEGPVSGDRGTVKRVLSGVFEWERDEDERVEARWPGGGIDLLRVGGRWTCRLFGLRAAGPPDGFQQ